MQSVAQGKCYSDVQGVGRSCMSVSDGLLPRLKYPVRCKSGECCVAASARRCWWLLGKNQK